MLGPLGLDATEEAIYLALLDTPSATAGQLASLVGVDRRRASAALGGLERSGLVTRPARNPPEYRAVAPEIAIDSLVQQRVTELDQVRRQAARLGEVHRRRAVRASSHVVELVSGYEATLAWALQVQLAATEEICLIDVPPYVLPPGQPNPVEAGLLARGIAYRVLYHVTSFDYPEKQEAARQCIAAGEQARIYSGTPIKMILADHRLGFAYDTNVQPIQDSIVVYPSFLLDQFRLLFDELWSRAAPLAPTSSGVSAASREAEALDPLDRQILALLAAGVQDDRIARQLGIGVRTVRRRVAALLSQLGATTRFQAGYLAKEAGLL